MTANLEKKPGRWSSFTNRIFADLLIQHLKWQDQNGKIKTPNVCLFYREFISGVPEPYFSSDLSYCSPNSVKSRLITLTQHIKERMKDNGKLPKERRVGVLTITHRSLGHTLEIPMRQFYVRVEKPIIPNMSSPDFDPMIFISDLALLQDVNNQQQQQQHQQQQKSLPITSI